MNTANSTGHHERAFPLSNQRGAILVVALWMLVLMAAMGATGVMLASTESSLAGNHRAERAALAAAQAGLERFTGRVNRFPSWPAELVRDGHANDAFSSQSMTDTKFASETTAAPDGNLNNIWGGANSGYYQVRVFPDDPVRKYYRVVSTGTLPGDTTTEVSVEGILRTVPYQAFEMAAMGCATSNIQAGAGGTYIVWGNSLAKGIVKVGVASAGDIYLFGDFSVIGSLTMDNDGVGASQTLLTTILQDATGSGGNVRATGSVTMRAGTSVQNTVQTPSFAPSVNATYGTWDNTAPVILDYCNPYKLARATPTIEAIDAMIETAQADGNVLGGAGGLFLANNQTLALGDGGIFYAPGGMTVRNTCSPCTYTGEGTIISGGGVTSNGGFLPLGYITTNPWGPVNGPNMSGGSPARVNLDNNTIGTARVDIIVRNNNSFTTGGTNTNTVINGTLQVGAVNEAGTIRTGTGMTIGNNTSLYIFGSAFVVGGATNNNQGGNLWIQYADLSNSSRLNKYEVGQWRRCTYDPATTLCT